MHIVLFEDEHYARLLPLAYWRTVFELRCGGGSLLDHVRACYSDVPITLAVRDELREIVAARTALPANGMPGDDAILLLNGRALLKDRLSQQTRPAACWNDDGLVWAWLDGNTARGLTVETLRSPAALRKALAAVPAPDAAAPAPTVLRYPWDFVHRNEEMILHAWKAARARGIEGLVLPGAHLLDERNIAIGRGSRIKPGATLDAEKGPIIIGENATVQPNAVISGPCIIGDGTLVQTGAAIGESSIGPVCKVGGEIECTVIQGYSNKQHDGFLGHAFIGEFCNLAADTVNSDLKNTYSNVRVPINGTCVDSGQMFVGLTMGDHAKSGIGQMFTTGAVVGFGSSVATSGLAPKFVPSFRWVTDGEDSEYDVEKCMNVAVKAMARRKRTLTAAEEQLFRSLPATARLRENAGDTG